MDDPFLRAATIKDQTALLRCMDQVEGREIKLGMLTRQDHPYGWQGAGTVMNTLTVSPRSSAFCNTVAPLLKCKWSQKLKT